MQASRKSLTLATLVVMAACWPVENRVAGQTEKAPATSAVALRSFQLRPDFTIELMAAEPLIESPVALDWGPDGKLWVVEMRDYPLGMDNKGKPGGRIVFLEDIDGDGRYDKSTVFLDGLLFPTGVMTWRQGVLVTSAPDIFYAEDMDGDGRADRREVLFTGFGEANPQHRVNGLRWGLDNWVYCANGDFAAARTFSPAGPLDKTATGFSPSQAEDLRRLTVAGARVKSVKTGAAVDIRNRDFRFRPDAGLLDPQAGQSQYGRDRDNWGNWFGCNNALPMWHYALADEYIRRNPHVAAPTPRVEAPRSVTYPCGPTGRDTGTRRRPEGNAWTSACSVMVYRDDLLGPGFANNWFVCEPVHNLVHREVLVAAGTTFTSRRAADEQASEFLTSTDPMFSPVSLRTGPDGALWVVDMYRKVLEHPHWLPAGWEKTMDVRAGHAHGRIYRVYPTGKKPRPIPQLDRADTAGLVALLESPNGPLRDKAQQLLIERRDASAAQMLEATAMRSERPLARLHALCTLEGLQALRPQLIQRALADAHAGVRRHAVRLSESRAARSAEVEAAALKLFADADPIVRLQLACSLGAWDSAAAGRALGQLLKRDGRDPYVKAAALSSLTPASLTFVLETVLAGSPDDTPPSLTADLLKTATGFGNWRAAATVMDRLVKSQGGADRALQFAALASWLDALEQRSTSLARLEQEADEELRARLKGLRAIFEAARKAVRSPEAALPERAQAVRLLGRGLDQQRADRETLAELLAPQTPDMLQAAAAAALGQLHTSEAPEALLKPWKGYTPILRSQVVEVLLRRPDGPKVLLNSLQRKQLLPQEIPLTAQQQLLGHGSPEVRTQAGKLLGGLIDSDREKVVAAYQASLRLQGDPKRGLQVFTTNCAACHRSGASVSGTSGPAVGPDLAAVRDKPPEWFLPALFDPSRAVDAKYLNYVATTQSGQIFTGILSEESGNSITLISATGQSQVILRSSLEGLASTGKSAMPDGLEKELTHQDVADLITYLRAQGPQAKQ
jgi:putative membrane-bound dehydrogenase-like protein